MVDPNPTLPNQPGHFTGNDIAADVRKKFGDDADVQIDADDLIRWINNGARRLASGAPWIKRSVATPLIASVGGYDVVALQTDLVAIDSVTSRGVPVPLISWQDYIQRTSAVQGVAPSDGTTQFASLYGDRLNIWPVPATTQAAALVIYFSSLPAKIVALTDLLPIPDRLFNALNDYVFQQALELDERFDEAEVKRQHTEAAIREQLADGNSPTGYYTGITETGADVW